jgi:hypothetical protein
MDDETDYREFLRFALQHFNIKVLNESDATIDLERDYSIAWENNRLYKLFHKGMVVAPFDDIEELCRFIHQDIKQNG